MAEKDIEELYLNQLDKDFVIDRKVRGTHFSGQRLEIDAILRPKDPSLWKNNNVALGVEFKDVERFKQSFDTNDYTCWLAQCVDYSNTNWDNYGFIYIFTCPDLLKYAFHEKYDASFFVRFLGQLGIGELKTLPKYGLTFVLHERHRMWSALNGLEEAKKWSLKKEFGSR